MPHSSITTARAAQMLNVSQRTVERMIERGKIEALVLDPDAKRKTYIIPRANFDNFRRTYRKKVRH